jgi:hypothetical protein
VNHLPTSPTAKEDALAVSAAVRLDCIRPERWHLVAAYLLDDGFDGEGVIGLASLSGTADGWDVAPLVEECLRDIDAPEVDVEEAGNVVARLMASALPASNYATVRYMAMYAPTFDYPGGAIGRAYSLSEWLDCDCHEGSPERAEAQVFEDDLRAHPLLTRPELPTAIFGSD